MSLQRFFLSFLLCALAGQTAWAERVEKSGERLYYVHAPDGLAENAKPGLLVWLHPASGNAQPEFDWWVQMGGPARNFILLCPQARERSWNPNDRRFVEDSIDEVIERFGVDRERVFLGGHSSGGFFTFYVGLRELDAFAGYIVAGAGTRKSIPRAGFDPPRFLLYHARDDAVIAFERAEKTREKLEEAGFAVTFVEGAHGHGIGPDLARATRDFLAEAEDSP